MNNNKIQIQKLIQEKNLIESHINLDTQLTPNGIDLTVAKIFEYDSPGSLDFSNSERVIPQGKEILPEKKNG